jgi:hypothetical protein
MLRNRRIHSGLRRTVHLHLAGRAENPQRVEKEKTRKKMLHLVLDPHPLGGAGHAGWIARRMPDGMDEVAPENWTGS